MSQIQTHIRTYKGNLIPLIDNQIWIHGSTQKGKWIPPIECQGKNRTEEKSKSQQVEGLNETTTDGINENL